MLILEKGISISPVTDKTELEKYEKLRELEEANIDYYNKCKHESFWGISGMSAVATITVVSIIIPDNISKLIFFSVTGTLFAVATIIECAGDFRLHTVKYYVSKALENKELPNMEKLKEKKRKRVISTLCEIYQAAPEQLLNAIGQQNDFINLISQTKKILKECGYCDLSEEVRNKHHPCNIYIGDKKELLTTENMHRVRIEDEKIYLQQDDTSEHLEEICETPIIPILGDNQEILDTSLQQSYPNYSKVRIKTLSYRIKRKMHN